MSAPQRPDYRANDLTPGQRYFDCRGPRADRRPQAAAVKVALTTTQKPKHPDASASMATVFACGVGGWG